MKFLSVLLFLTALVVYTEAHGRMVNPINRGSAWRIHKKKNLPVSTVDSEWCYQHLFSGKEDFSGRNATCGICGPVYSGNSTYRPLIHLPNRNEDTEGLSYEYNTPFNTGLIVKSYRKGSTIKVTIHIGAMHGGGPTSFRICSADGLNSDPSQKCFDENVLKFTNGKYERDMLDGRNGRLANYKYGTDKDLYHFYVRLPEDLTCDHCVLQWVWGPTTGDNNQEYHGCADVKIRA